MARTQVAPTVSQHTGSQLALAAFDLVNGMGFGANTGTMVLIFRNAGAGPVTVTVRTNHFVDGDLKTPDRAVVVGAGQIELVGTFPPDIYNQADGLVYMDASGALQYAAIQIV